MVVSVGSGSGRLSDKEDGIGRSMPVGIGKSREMVVSVGSESGRLNETEDEMRPRLASSLVSRVGTGKSREMVVSVGSGSGTLRDKEVGSSGSTRLSDGTVAIVGSEMDGTEIEGTEIEGIEIEVGKSRDMDVATEMDVGMRAACIDAARATVTRSLLNIVVSRRVVSKEEI